MHCVLHGLQRKGDFEMRKGFVSVMTIALVTTLVISLVALVYSLNSFQQATLNDLRITLTGNRYEDAVAFLNSTINDAVIDAAYAECGCAKTPGSSATNLLNAVNSRLQAYFSGSESKLSDSITSVRASVLPAAFTIPPSTCDSIDSALSISYSLNASTSTAQKVNSINANWRVTIRRVTSGGNFFYVKSEGEPAFEVQVNCPA